jgi:hypothetical protein
VWLAATGAGDGATAANIPVKSRKVMAMEKTRDGPGDAMVGVGAAILHA